MLKALLLPGLLALLPAALQAQDGPVPAPWVTGDSAARTVRLALEVTRPSGAPSASINGYREGGVQVVVPAGWSIGWDWKSVDSTAPHSLVVMAEREKLPTEGGGPVFTNAMTKMVTAGLTVGQSDRTTFEPDQPGWYWMLCGVPNHALAGEWIGLRIDPAATTAGIKVK